MSCIYYEWKAFTPTNSKLVAKYVFLQAPFKLETRLAGSGGDSRTAPPPHGKFHYEFRFFFQYFPISRDDAENLREGFLSGYFL